MGVFTLTAAMLVVLGVAARLNAEATLEEGNDLKRQIFTKLCEVECTKLKCVGSEPLPDTNGCTCTSCDMGPVGVDIEKEQVQTKSTLDHLRLQFYMKGTNTTINRNHTLTREQSPPTEQEKETLNKTCVMECNRLDCGSFTFDVYEHKCLCHTCDLEAVSDSDDGQHGRKRKKRSNYSCNYRLIPHSTRRETRTCTGGGWWSSKRCYNHIVTRYKNVRELCCRPLDGFNGNITIALR